MESRWYWLVGYCDGYAGYSTIKSYLPYFPPTSSLVHLSIIPYSDNIVPLPHSLASLAGQPIFLKVHSPCIQRSMGSDLDICLFTREYTIRIVGRPAMPGYCYSTLSVGYTMIDRYI